MDYFDRSSDRREVRSDVSQRGTIPLGMWYIEVSEFLGSQNCISILDMYESLIEENADIEEGRNRNIT